LVAPAAPAITQDSTKAVSLYGSLSLMAHSTWPKGEFTMRQMAMCEEGEAQHLHPEHLVAEERQQQPGQQQRRQAIGGLHVIAQLHQVGGSLSRLRERVGVRVQRTTKPSSPAFSRKREKEPIPDVRTCLRGSVSFRLPFRTGRPAARAALRP
jgi:hypothetical protein